MAKNVFDKIGDISNNINRSTFDWSHTNNFTTGLGRITPVFCELCPPGSSLKLKPDYGLQFMPMMYPVQTKMKSYLSFYRVPLRTLWKDYMDFTSGIPGQTYEPPYIKFPANSFSPEGALRVSSLADYFGIPVTSPLRTANFQSLNLYKKFSTSILPEFTTYDGIRYADIPEVNHEINFSGVGSDVPSVGRRGKKAWLVMSTSPIQYSDGAWHYKETFPNASEYGKSEFRTGIYRMRLYGPNVLAIHALLREFPESLQLCGIFKPKGNQAMNSLPANIKETVVVNEWNLGSVSTARIVELYDDGGDQSTSYLDVEFDYSNWYCIPEFNPTQLARLDTYMASRVMIGLDFSGYFFDSMNWGSKKELVFGMSKSDIQGKISADFTSASLGVSELSKDTCPYYFDGCDESKSPIKISAYPFRAYEAIYNSYIRNTRNNPFMLNGKPVYNKWITNDAGGADATTPLSLRRANWASDAFTTALAAPQQGKAPLVGITTYTDTHMDDNGHQVNDMKFALVDEDGKKYGLTFISNGEELKNVEYSELSSNQQVRPISSLFDLATSGISINDFRNVNAYQRYLELNQFRGFSYKEIVEGRYDVNVKYDALNMPEYLGGITRDVVVNPVTQTVETSNAGTYSGALGSQAGIAGVRGNGDGTISVYCDEESLVVGIISVVPMPVYTQCLPKYMLYRDRLDSYTPEFDHIGYQPIGLSELCPVLDFVQNGKNTNSTFGYQRPWYEYVQKRDSAHGIFRTQLRNFLINRVFDGVPELGSDFTTVNEADVNSVFAVTETTDKIFGQIYFDVTAKLPISRVVVPKLE